jgi:hypothetical protein
MPQNGSLVLNGLILKAQFRKVEKIVYFLLVQSTINPASSSPPFPLSPLISCQLFIFMYNNNHQVTV